MIEITLSTMVRQNPSMISTEADGEIMMLDIDANKYHGFNQVASFIWHALAEPRAVSSVCAAIGEEFEVDESVCQAETLAFIAELVRDGLAEVVA